MIVTLKHAHKEGSRYLLRYCFFTVNAGWRSLLMPLRALTFLGVDDEVTVNPQKAVY